MKRRLASGLWAAFCLSFCFAVVCPSSISRQSGPTGIEFGQASEQSPGGGTVASWDRVSSGPARWSANKEHLFHRIPKWRNSSIDIGDRRYLSKLTVIFLHQ